MGQSPNVILLCADESDDEHGNSVLKRILSDYATLTLVRDLSGLLSLLEQRDCDAIFCGWSGREESWSASLGRIREQCPDLPIIVFFRTAGEEEWIEVLEAGAFDMLSWPYRKDVVIPILEHAIASRQARRWHNLVLKDTPTAS